jgi:hypothetical protein
MDVNPESVDDRDMLAEGDHAAANETLDTAPLCAHNLMSVLMPATPPEPKNARIVRLFDIEAAKYDPRPGEPAAVQPARKEQQRNRAALREQRSQSLFAAARYF